MAQSFCNYATIFISEQDQFCTSRFR